MRDATILLARRYGASSAFSIALGEELRSVRLDRGLTQRQVAAPLTSAYVSSIERGRVLPSLPALAWMLERLEVPLPEYFDRVNFRLRRMYTAERV